MGNFIITGQVDYKISKRTFPLLALRAQETLSRTSSVAEGEILANLDSEGVECAVKILGL